MSYDLPQATKTKKVQSLSSDQRRIAEELIAEKFGVKEEVVAKKQPSFRQEYPGDVRFASTPAGPNGFYDVFSESDVANLSRTVRVDRHRADEVNTRVDFYNRRRVSSVAIASCSTRGILDAIRRLDEENLPRNGRTIRLGRGFWDNLRREPELMQFLAYRAEEGRGYSREMGEYAGHMFGCKIFVAEGIMPEVEVTY